MVEITFDKIDYDLWINKVSDPEAGAVSTFIGVTRNNTGKRKVKYLDYEAYESMALTKMEQIINEMRDQFDIKKAVMIHRLGKVAVEEASVLIAVSSAHRKAAIHACHFAIDRLKEIVPIWKKEVMEDASEEWIANGEAFGIQTEKK